MPPCSNRRNMLQTSGAYLRDSGPCNLRVHGGVRARHAAARPMGVCRAWSRAFDSCTLASQFSRFHICGTCVGELQSEPKTKRAAAAASRGKAQERAAARRKRHAARAMPRKTQSMFVAYISRGTGLALRAERLKRAYAGHSPRRLCAPLVDERARLFRNFFLLTHAVVPG